MWLVCVLLRVLLVTLAQPLYAVAYVLALLRHGPRDRWRKKGDDFHLSQTANYALVQRSMHAYTMAHSETKKPKPLETLNSLSCAK